MRLDHLRDRCLALPETTEGLPFGPDPLVFKVAGKMFALLSLDVIPSRVGLKCDPEWALTLREEYEAIGTSPYLHKRLWNSVTLDGSVPSSLVREMVEHSYRLVVAKLKKADRLRIEAAEGYPAASSEDG